MSTQREIAIEPIINYPSVAEPGHSYLMTIDLRPQLGESDWPYDKEEYVINCHVKGSELFSIEPLGDATVIMHRFGGTYGPARFILTANNKEREGSLWVTLIDGWGIPIGMQELKNVQIEYRVKDEQKSPKTIVLPPSRSSNSTPTDRVSNDDIESHVPPKSHISTDSHASTVITTENMNAFIEWFSETVTMPFVEKIKGIRYDKKEQMRWKRSIDVYAKSLVNDYGYTRLLGSSRDIQLADIFTDVYILDKPTAYRRYNIEQLVDEGVEYFTNMAQTSYSSSERQSGIALIKQHHNLYILGKPGAGKTTFMKYVTILGVHNQFNKLPVFISLHDWANGPYDELLPYIIREFDICHLPDVRSFVEHLLQEGWGILIFDGLDEVQQEGGYRQNVRRLLQDFTRKYDRCQYLITCRLTASEFSFSGFLNVEMADFIQEQVRSYAKKWFGAGSRKYKFFIAALEEDQNRGIRELCNVPILLSLVCLYFDDNMAFPQRRSELYADALDTLLRKWDQQRNLKRDIISYGNLSPRRKQQMLAHIATSAFEKGQYFFKSYEIGQQIANYLSKLPGVQQAVEDIDGEAVLQEITSQHGLLVERASNIYSFAHLIFQEYFTACYIVENEARGTTKALITNNLIDQRWREIFFLVASMLEDSDDFCQIMRTELDQFLVQRDNLTEMITWSQTRTRSVNPAYDQQVSTRLSYMILYCAHDHNFDYHPIYDFVSAFDSSSDHIHVLNGAIEQTCRLTHTSFEDLNSCLAVACDVAEYIDVQVGLDYGLYYARTLAEANALVVAQDDIVYEVAFPQLLDLCQMADAHKLGKALGELSIPQPNCSDPAEEWTELAKVLGDLMHIHRDFRLDWSFKLEDWDSLNNYFYANELLVRCLDLAFVSDRQGFKNRLLLSPESIDSR